MMLKRIKCIFLGHRWHYVSRAEYIFVTHYSWDRLERKGTILFYKCNCCGKHREEKLLGQYGEIPADDLIEVD